MNKSFHIGDHVRWNSEAGHVTGVIKKVHRKDFNYKGYTHHASLEDPHYEIKSDKSDHIAIHKSVALTLIHACCLLADELRRIPRILLKPRLFRCNMILIDSSPLGMRLGRSASSSLY
jgi:hypothetical protein